MLTGFKILLCLYLWWKLKTILKSFMNHYVDFVWIILASLQFSKTLSCLKLFRVLSGTFFFNDTINHVWWGWCLSNILVQKHYYQYIYYIIIILKKNIHHADCERHFQKLLQWLIKQRSIIYTDEALHLECKNIILIPNLVIARYIYIYYIIYISYINIYHQTSNITSPL